MGLYVNLALLIQQVHFTDKTVNKNWCFYRIDLFLQVVTLAIWTCLFILHMG